TSPPAVPEPVVDQSVIDITTPREFIFDPAAKTISTIKVDNTPVIAVSSITKPKILQASKPAYPTASIRLGEEGATGLRLYINEMGRVIDVQLASSSGSERLDSASIAHAKRNWKFSPCMEGDKAVACWHQTKLVWKLENAR
ncbi:MAG TPA: energy transducer TonB, partial [Cellvibrio sp.]